MIGKGSFGKVHLGVQILTGQKVAIKCIDKSCIKEEKAYKKIVQEGKILRSLDHPNIIKILEVFENKKYVFCVMMYYKEGDLLKHLKKREVLSEDEAKDIFLPILTSLHGIHSQKILHRDIKLDNILLHENLEPIICDFGVSRKMKDGEVVNEQCGTPAYIAPEIIKDKGYIGFKADIWSLGVLLFAMVTGKMPIKGPTIEDLHDVIKMGDFTFPKSGELLLSNEVKDLINHML